MKWIVIVAKQPRVGRVPLVGRTPRVWIAMSFEGNVHPWAVYPNVQRHVGDYVLPDRPMPGGDRGDDPAGD